MKVVIHQDRCIGAGQCVLSAGTVFDQDDDGIVILLDDAPPESDYAAVRAAAKVCPAMAIELVE
ncbi:ferredoxin [Compostimonas suwonensis]|uniref:Ferredoxin n=1 Tax=Compostimonas suwonensis TaxID=1048394 RepID=A0A2M9BWS4_9MICO|nr:ferredoxin [Compostimonas suwonensis]PJJ62413.1 ferredoxin [Compostimonas suwonensis]